MFKIIEEEISKKKVIYAPHRLERHKNLKCPFCAGNEELSPTEVFRLGSSQPNSKNWKVRVVSNKFPISEFHEVIVHSPSETELHQLSDTEVFDVFKVFKERYQYYHQLGQVVIFSNQGESSGATINHQHSQIVVLPLKTQTDILPKQKIENQIQQIGDMVSFCPEFSQHPYEVHITSYTNNGRFGSLKDDDLKDLSVIFKNTISALKKILNEDDISDSLSYNFYISPVENWYLRIIPRIQIIGGFELATNMSINVTLPNQAHERFQKALGQESLSTISELKTADSDSQKTQSRNNNSQTEPEPEKPKTEKERMDDVLGKLGSF